jgi:hypothetical protein
LGEVVSMSLMVRPQGRPGPDLGLGAEPAGAGAAGTCQSCQVASSNTDEGLLVLALAEAATDCKCKNSFFPCQQNSGSEIFRYGSGSLV